MNSLAVALILSSAGVHAVWNLAARRRKSEVTFFGRMLIWVAVLFSPWIVIEILKGGEVVRATWPQMMGSGVAFGVYFYALARAYRGSDFTIVYPVARAVPILIVAVADTLLDRAVTAPAVLGMGLVVMGCIFTPLRSFREVRLMHYVHRSMLWVGLAIAATVTFTLFDKSATRAFDGGWPAFRYLYFPYALCAIVYWALAGLFGRDEDDDAETGWRMPFVASFMTYGGYGLIVWALKLSRQASYVVAFRQVSIIIGVVLAFIIYREKGLWPRLTGAVLMVAGLIMVALLGNSAG